MARKRSAPKKRNDLIEEIRRGRMTSQEPLATVFKELNCHSAESRQEVRQWLDLLGAQHRVRRRHYEAYSRQAVTGWLTDVEKTAAKFLKLLQNVPPLHAEPIRAENYLLGSFLDGRDPVPFIEDVRRVRDAAADPRKWPNVYRKAPAKAYRKGPEPDQASKYLVAELIRGYEHYTKKVARLSRSWSTKRPGGPFFRLVRAVFDLFGESGKSDDALAAVINRVRRDRKAAQKSSSVKGE